MTKSEFLDRVARRALSRYGEIFHEALLNDLLKDDLIPASERVKNSGKAPSYKYSYQAYRRAMQIVRLRKYGIVGRDAQRVILFLRGYSQSVLDVKQALINEYVKAGKALIGPIRSTYADNSRTVPPKQKDRFIQRMGKLDDRLNKSQIAISADTYIDILRVAKQRPLETGVQTGLNILHPPIDEQLPPDMLNLFSGMLMFDPANSDNSKTIDYVEKLILNSGDKRFYEARSFYQSFESVLAAAGPAFFPVATKVERERAINGIVLAIKNAPNWSCLVFVLGLKFVSDNGVPSKS